MTDMSTAYDSPTVQSQLVSLFHSGLAGDSLGSIRTFGKDAKKKRVHQPGVRNFLRKSVFLCPLP